VYTHNCQERDILFAKGRTVNSQSDVILVAGSARLESGKEKEGRIKRDSSANLTSAFRSYRDNVLRNSAFGSKSQTSDIYSSDGGAVVLLILLSY
jgi:hypothetical protein